MSYACVHAWFKTRMICCKASALTTAQLHCPALQTGTHVGLSRLTVQRGKLNKAIKILPMPLSSWCTDFILMIMPEDISSVGTAELPTF